MELVTPEGGLLFWVIFSLVIIVLPVVAIVHLIRHTSPNNIAKLIWVLIILMLPILGSVLYFLFGRTRLG
jgi:hypothetical protein